MKGVDNIISTGIFMATDTNEEINNFSHEMKCLLLTSCIFQVEIKEVSQNEKQIMFSNRNI